MTRGVVPKVALMAVMACKPTSEEAASTPPSSTPPSSTPEDPTTKAPATNTPAPAIDEPPIPQGSGDYAAVLADARAYKRGEIDYKALEQRILARKLPPHPLGDEYVIMPVPAPPPGVPFDPMMMPSDWERTWGEVAMAHFAGVLTREEYDRLHAAAHPQCKR